MFSLFCPILNALAQAIEEENEREHFRRQRWRARERYEWDVAKGRIEHVMEDVQ